MRLGRLGEKKRLGESKKKEEIRKEKKKNEFSLGKSEGRKGSNPDLKTCNPFDCIR